MDIIRNIVRNSFVWVVIVGICLCAYAAIANIIGVCDVYF